MTAPADRCFKCGVPLPGRDAAHKRICTACAATLGPGRAPVPRGPKPADHGERVSRGWQLRLARLALERAANGEA